MNLRQYRNSRGLQRKFVVSNIQISGKHLNDIEGGRVNLTDKIALKLSNFYCISVKKIREMYEEGKNE
ncbi:TPA: helix-turn-helix transcriptional regulator [Clostridium botulinum]|nr:helix-turn-helix transcriptional regulator [Clostridium botulinum]